MEIIISSASTEFRILRLLKFIAGGLSKKKYQRSEVAFFINHESYSYFMKFSRILYNHYTIDIFTQAKIQKT